MLEPVNYLYRVVSLSRVLREGLEEVIIIFVNCDIKLVFTPIFEEIEVEPHFFFKSGTLLYGFDAMMCVLCLLFADTVENDSSVYIFK